jgi:hypothetical protein
LSASAHKDLIKCSKLPSPVTDSMARNDSTANWFQQVKGIWGPLAQAGAWVAGIIGGFLLPPPVGAEENKLWLRFAQFVITIVVGLMILPSRKWRRKKDAKWWWLMAAICLAAAVGSFFAYQRVTYSSTCETLEGGRVVIGYEYTPHGADYIRENPGISCADLIDQHIGKTEDVWTKRSIDAARMKLTITYIACIPLFTICLMALIQAIYCATK